MVSYEKVVKAINSTVVVEYIVLQTKQRRIACVANLFKIKVEDDFDSVRLQNEFHALHQIHYGLINMVCIHYPQNLKRFNILIGCLFPPHFGSRLATNSRCYLILMRDECITQ